MDDYFILELPVYGRIGDGSVWDKSRERPVISKLHYELDFKPDSELFKTFPVFIASERLTESLLRANFTGFEIAAMTISTSQTFLKLHPREPNSPRYSWLKVHGRATIDDFGVNAQSKGSCINNFRERGDSLTE